MKINIGETKRGIILTFEDETGSRTIHLKWIEAIGLFHELDESLKNPAFHDRDPKGTHFEVRNLRTVD